MEYITDFAREFSDQASLKTSTTRAVNLFHESGLSREAFIDHMYQARAITKERSASVRAGSTSDAASSRPARRKMAYFFACLEDQLGLREEGHSAHRLSL